MKKLVVAAVVIALAVPMLAWGASNYVPSFKDGKYTGKFNSVVPALNGKDATMDLKVNGNKVTATVDYGIGKEVWEWDETKLRQKEIDKTTNKVVMEYGATAKNPITGNKQAFHVDCQAEKCDAGAAPESHWTIEGKDKTITYQFYGKPQDKLTDPTVKIEKRHEVIFVKSE